MEDALRQIGSSGLTGALLVLALLAIGYLFRSLQALHAERREDIRTVTTALLTQAEAQNRNTQAIAENTQVIRALVLPKGG